MVPLTMVSGPCSYNLFLCWALIAIPPLFRQPEETRDS